jgi:predicted RNA binding protein YcfA (HicA-like mRNA interferase family)
MSKKAKRIHRLFAKPPPTDFSWDELIAVMKSAGFSEYCDGGSHYTFEHANGYSFCMSKTHPSGILKRYQVDDAKEALLVVIATGENANGAD